MNGVAVNLSIVFAVDGLISFRLSLEHQRQVFQASVCRIVPGISLIKNATVRKINDSDNFFPFGLCCAIS